MSGFRYERQAACGRLKRGVLFLRSWCDENEPVLFVFSYRTTLALTAAALASAFAFGSCATEDLVMGPSPAALQISANPTAIPVLGGVSTITVIGQESTPVGVVPLQRAQIFFTTTVGTIDPQVEMLNGIARVLLRSDGRAGLASVTATADQGGRATLDPEVLIGNATGINIVLTANPASLIGHDDRSELVATAFDNGNNILRDVPIIFDASTGAVASRGSIVYTNALGRAVDWFTLRDATMATIVARSGSVVSNEVTVSRSSLKAPLRSSVSASPDTRCFRVSVARGVCYSTAYRQQGG